MLNFWWNLLGKKCPTLFILLIKATNAAEYYERYFDLNNDDIWLVQRRYLTCTKTKFDLYKDEIWLVQRRYLICTKTRFDLYKEDI